ncbi:isochorismatase family hydrolase like protein [Zymoseptoria brevis]|uniref:nicotinamidase n=1 Tax=Zymoseptoria brevis TaxID=1047168 RepID=A0A0F4GGM0_9PEZI|nr:isochorismatase family hydrolase like protein [Zymoseptoria brevis]
MLFKPLRPRISPLLTRHTHNTHRFATMASSSSTPARKAALAVIDMQEDFCEPNGPLAVKDGRSVAPIINELMDRPGFSLKIGTRDFHPRNHVSFASNHKDMTPFTSKHTIHNPYNEKETQTTLLWPDHCVQGTPGVLILPELQREKLTHIVNKGMDPLLESYSAFGPPFRHPEVSMSGLTAILKENGITDIFVVGLAFDFCVKHTALDAVEQGFKAYVIEDATRAVDQSEEGLKAVKEELVAAGVNIVGLESEELP